MKTIIKAALAIALVAAMSTARLLDGYYQVTNLKITRDGQPVRGFNNSGLYIYGTDKRIKVAGAFRGYPIEYDMIVERVSGDTLTLRDIQNRTSQYKFLVSGQYITGRHALNHEDGTRQIIEIIATVRKMRPEEVGRLRGVINF